MKIVDFNQRAASDVVERYIDAKRKSERPLSTGKAVLAIRTVLPDCRLTDRELVDMIAAAAMGKGCNVEFDSPPH